MTGFHLLHVLAGVGILAHCSSACAAARCSREPPRRRRGDDLLLALRLHRLGRHFRDDLSRAMKRERGSPPRCSPRSPAAAASSLPTRPAGIALRGYLRLRVAAAGLCAAGLGWAFWILPARASDRRNRDLSVDARPTAAAEAAPQLPATREVTRRARAARAACAPHSAPSAWRSSFRFARSGPRPDGELFNTRWRRGSRVVREDGSPVHVADLDVDSAVTVFPEGALGDAQSQAMLIRLPAALGGSVQRLYCLLEGLHARRLSGCALSRASEAAACARAINRSSTSSRTARSSPGPPITRCRGCRSQSASDGILRATGDFPEPVGPGFWERGERDDAVERLAALVRRSSRHGALRASRTAQGLSRSLVVHARRDQPLRLHRTGRDRHVSRALLRPDRRSRITGRTRCSTA